jgi:hypothetical protein
MFSAAEIGSVPVLLQGFEQPQSEQIFFALCSAARFKIADMPVTPWKAHNQPSSGNRYVALISYLPLEHFRALPKFFVFTFQIMRQLEKSSGLIGYSLDAHPFAGKFWTLSVWRDQKALSDFVGAIPHSRIMKSLAPHMGKTQFAQWTVEAHEVPLDWKSARARVAQS